MGQHLTAPRSQPVGDPIDGRTSTNNIPNIPGQFPIEDHDLFDWLIPDATFIESEEMLKDAPPQQESSSEKTADLETSDPCTSPSQSPNSSKLESSMATKSSTKDSPKPKHNREPRPVISKSRDIVIAVFGLTGTGKSSFISKLTGKEVKIGHSLQSCKQYCIGYAISISDNFSCRHVRD